MAKIKTIGILTSGGDAPGMNAAIRAVTISELVFTRFEIKAVYRGYDGLITDDIFTTEMSVARWSGGYNPQDCTLKSLCNG